MNNFTPRAQKVLENSRAEADRFNHGYIGTEHLLLGILALDGGPAVERLAERGVDADRVRLEVEKSVKSGGELKTLGHVPYTPRVKKVLASIYLLITVWNRVSTYTRTCLFPSTKQ